MPKSQKKDDHFKNKTSFLNDCVINSSSDLESYPNFKVS